MDIRTVFISSGLLFAWPAILLVGHYVEHNHMQVSRIRKGGFMPSGSFFVSLYTQSRLITCKYNIKFKVFFSLFGYFAAYD